MHLDVFNLNIARQEADMEIDRRGLKRLEDQPQGWVSWAKSWYVIILFFHSFNALHFSKVCLIQTL